MPTLKSIVGLRLSAFLPGLFSSGGFLRRVAILAGGNAFAQSITIIATPLITRLYGPHELGTLGLYVSFVGVASVALSLGYETAIVSAVDSRESAYLTLLCSLLILPIGLVLSAVFVCLIHFSLFGFASVPDSMVVLVFISMILLGAFTVLKYWLLRENAYGMVTYSSVMQNWCRTACQVGLGVVGLGWIGLVGGDLAGRICGLGRMVRSSQESIRKHLKPICLSDIVRVARTYVKFPLLSLPSSLVNSLAFNLPVPLIALSYGIHDAGQFALVLQAVTLPMAFVGQGIGDAFHSRLAEYARQRQDMALPFFLRVTGSLIALSVPPNFVLLLAGEQLFRIVFGMQWGSAGVLASMLIPRAIAQFVVSPLTRAAYVYQRQELKLFYDVLSLALVCLVIVVGYQASLPLSATVLGLSLAQATAYAVLYLQLLHIVRANSRKPVTELSGAGISARTVNE